ncbi:SLAP domain-containing protein [Lactobacillus sp. LL6]|uniref:SLAP domain-containing protein n=1 Tax=Lactobacillus sp. LL6 TaxID=2596827 RepID=UPI00118715B2|nr:SLAP domain-containing protein [Lactobacillus sp. LL6]TSO25432.1 hypothetical protein FOD82_09390 [Lactobacillus sp. LL6]
MKIKKLLTLSTMLVLGISPAFINNQIQVNAETIKSKNTFTLEIPAYIYKKDGKQTHVDEITDANGNSVKLKQTGDVTLIPKGTKLQYFGKPVSLKTYINTSQQTSNGDLKMYFNIGHGYYINAKNVGITNGPTNITLDHNSYIYNSNGKRNKHAKTIKKNTTLIVPGKFQKITKPTKYYSEYLSSSGIKFVDWQKRHRFFLKYTTINGKQFYQIGKNRYIKANNIIYLDGKPMYTNAKETTIVLKSGQQIVNMNSNSESGHYYHKGQKLKVDKYVSTFRGYPNDFWFKTGIEDGVFYHVKGTKDNWVWGRVSEVNVKRNIEPINLPNTKNTFMQFKPGIPKGIIYNKNGEPKYSNKFYNAESTNYYKFGYYPLAVKELKYIYVAKDKKAELFYHVQLTGDDLYLSLVNKDGNQISTDPSINDFYLKADNLQYVAGIKLKPINTPQAKN